MRTAWLLPVAVLLSGCAGSGQTQRTSGGVVHAPLCYSAQRSPRAPCDSPDGAWTVEFRPGPGRLLLTRVSTGARTVDYSSRDSCCDDITWVRPHRLVFADDFYVFTLNPARRTVRFIADFSDFYVSPDGRWLAGYAAAPPDEPHLAGLVSLATGKCLLVPGKNDYVGANVGWATPRTGFSRPGDAVVAAVAEGKAVRYPISAFRQPCPLSMTRKP